MNFLDHDARGRRPRWQPMRWSRGKRRLALAPIFVLMALALGGCELPTFGGFRGATKQGQTEFTLWSWTVIAGLVIAVIVWLLIFWCIGRYRHRDGHIPRQFSEHIPLEITYTVIPLIIVAFLFWATVVAENKIDAVTTSPNEIVQVTGYRWGWRFQYEAPNGASQHVLVQTAGEPVPYAQSYTSPDYPQLVLPDNATIRIVLESSDVIHGFYIPAFNFSRYAQPGVTNIFDFTTTQVGVFDGRCSQYCGLYHSEMLFSVKVVAKTQFTQWLQSKQT